MTRIVLIGAGWAGAVHATASGAVKGAHVSQVLSRTEDSARRLVEGGGATGVAVGTYDQLAPGAEIAVVATPAAHHREAVERALAAGCAVLVEKPLGVDVADADAIVAAAEASGALCGYAENLLFAPSYRRLADHVDRIGPLHRLHLWFRSDAPRWGHFHAPLPGGGVLHDLGAHPVALALALAGSEPTSVAASIDSRRSDGMDDEATATIRFESGLEAGIEVSWRADSPAWSVEVASASGAARWEVFPEDLLELDGEDATLRPADPDRPEAPLASLGYVAQLQGFADAVAGRGGAVCPLGFGRRVAQITAAAYASAEAGGAPQPVPAP